MSVLARMERRGISIDRQVLSRLSGEFAQKQGGLEDEISKLAGEPLNPGSPKQLGDILFGKMRLCRAAPRPRPGNGRPARARSRNWPSRATSCRRRSSTGGRSSKLRSTYTDALPGYVNAETHRVHTNYALAATTTGRLSSSEPNLQNIPVRTEEGRKIRRAFIADARQQARLRRLLADRAAAARRDRRRAGAAQGVPRRPRHPRHDGVGDVRRAGARTCRPRCAAAPRRSISASSTASRRSGSPTSSASPREEAGAYIKKYFERFPGIRDYMEETKAFCQEERLRAHPVRPQVPLPRHRRLQRLDPRLQRARRHQRPPAGHRRRHHPPRHGPHGAGAARRPSSTPRCCCRCTTN